MRCTCLCIAYMPAWLAQRLLDELHEIMGGAEKSMPLSDLMEPSELAGRVRVSQAKVSTTEVLALALGECARSLP